MADGVGDRQLRDDALDRLQLAETVSSRPRQEAALRREGLAGADIVPPGPIGGDTGCAAR